MVEARDMNAEANNIASAPRAEYSVREHSDRLIRAMNGPEDDGSVCTRWWAEEITREHMWAEASLSGEEPEVVPDHFVWLSPEDLPQLETLDVNSSTRGASSAAGEADGAPRPRPSDARGAGAAERAELGRLESEEGEAWMEQAAGTMDVWADVLCASLDYAHGIRTEERARREAEGPYYAHWAHGAPVFCSQSGADFYAW
ncbi:hypothetical protein BC628DRAFT_925359 [Trametes gibbosa]|nr:hypothetical protein BC628DRAFT_925359 [Trametes gibbosa]